MGLVSITSYGKIILLRGDFDIRNLTTHSTRAEIVLLSCARLGFNGAVCRRVNSGVRRLLSEVEL
jgi:hypothetical protein